MNSQNERKGTCAGRSERDETCESTTRSGSRRPFVVPKLRKESDLVSATGGDQFTWRGGS